MLSKPSEKLEEQPSHSLSMFIIVTRYRLNSARLMSPGDSGPGLPEESPVLGSQSFSLWRKLLTIGRYLKLWHLQCLLRVRNMQMALHGQSLSLGLTYCRGPAQTQGWAQLFCGWRLSPRSLATGLPSLGVVRFEQHRCSKSAPLLHRPQ